MCTAREGVFQPGCRAASLFAALLALGLSACGAEVEEGAWSWEDGPGVGRSALTPPAGSLDTSFGTAGSGIIITSTSSESESLQDAALQADGKLVAVGYTFNTAASSWDFLVMRYGADGVLDPSFGDDGIVTTQAGPGTASDFALQLALQEDGKIVVAGYTLSGGVYVFAAARYNPDGSLDPAFDGDGIVMTPLGTSHAYAQAIALQADGKILLGGQATSPGGNADFAVVRYNPDGSLDTSFGGSGSVRTPVGVGTDSIRALLVQPDGRIAAAGSGTNTSGNTDFALVRYNANGSLDTGFDGDGKLLIHAGSHHNTGYNAALQADGKILVTGDAAGTASYEFAAARVNANGSLDTGFGVAGKVLVNVAGSNAKARSVLVQDDGKIVLAGMAARGADPGDTALVRLNPNGSLDTSFDGDGKVLTALHAGDVDGANNAVLQGDGKILAVGFRYAGTYSDVALARYWP